MSLLQLAREIVVLSDPTTDFTDEERKLLKTTLYSLEENDKHHLIDTVLMEVIDVLKEDAEMEIKVILRTCDFLNGCPFLLIDFRLEHTLESFFVSNVNTINKYDRSSLYSSSMFLHVLFKVLPKRLVVTFDFFHMFEMRMEKLSPLD